MSAPERSGDNWTLQEHEPALRAKRLLFVSNGARRPISTLASAANQGDRTIIPHLPPCKLPSCKCLKPWERYRNQRHELQVCRRQSKTCDCLKLMKTPDPPNQAS